MVEDRCLGGTFSLTLTINSLAQATAINLKNISFKGFDGDIEYALLSKRRNQM